MRFLLENEYLLGNADINRDGYTIYTTLDLDYQEAARRHINDGIAKANRIYDRNSSNSTSFGTDAVALTELLALAFNLEGIQEGGSTALRAARQEYRDGIVDVIDVVTLLFGDSEADLLRQVTAESQGIIRADEQRTTVEGALIAVENGSGHILAMVGGSRFESRNQFNRAVDSRIEPGSSFKPLYYAAAIEDRVITPATLIYDSPVIFWNDDGTPYTPQNYRGRWRGRVLVREALARSMNVPSLRVLEQVGFSSALETARQLLGISEGAMIERNLVRRYPVGLGVVEVSPLEMTRAYSVFANKGIAVEPLAVRFITDRDGKIVAEPEREHVRQLAASPQRVLEEQTAYVMTNLLQSTTNFGTLAYAVGQAEIPEGIDIAGKTGTTQNWADAWTVGFTPYMTTAVWFGFDRGGFNSLGTNQTGAVTAGPIWARFMSDVHTDLPPRSFTPPSEGITRQQITARSGLLAPEGYGGRKIEEIFLAGTEPTEFDAESAAVARQQARFENRLRSSIYDSGTRGARELQLTTEDAVLLEGGLNSGAEGLGDATIIPETPPPPPGPGIGTTSLPATPPPIQDDAGETGTATPTAGGGRRGRREPGNRHRSPQRRHRQ